MATCPRCLGPLTDDHRCPRNWLRRLGDSLFTVTVGGIVGVVLCFALEERPTSALVLAAAALGAVLASAFRQAVGPRF